MIDKYEKQNPNVTVETQLSTWSEYWTKLEASALVEQHLRTCG